MAGRSSKLLPIYPSHTEYLAVLEACTNDRDRMLIALCFATGGRISEVLATRVGDITRSGLRMPSLKQGSSAQKHVFLPKTFLARLRAYCRGRAKTEPIITHLHDGAAMTRQNAHHIITQAGLRAHVLKQRFGETDLRPPWPHAYRHASAIYLLENGVPINAVSQQLGHANLQSTARYLALADPHREAIMNKVAF